jgi:hypothetical protein
VQAKDFANPFQINDFAKHFDSMRLSANNQKPKGCRFESYLRSHSFEQFRSKPPARIVATLVISVSWLGSALQVTSTNLSPFCVHFLIE